MLGFPNTRNARFTVSHSTGQYLVLLSMPMHLSHPDEGSMPLIDLRRDLLQLTLWGTNVKCRLQELRLSVSCWCSLATQEFRLNVNDPIA